MKCQRTCKEPTSEEKLQLKYLDKLEEAMDYELRRNCSLADKWISRLESESEKSGCCPEAKQRISRLLYLVADGAYSEPDNIYADQE